jgi:hypothetical protein
LHLSVVVFTSSIRVLNKNGGGECQGHSLYCADRRTDRQISVRCACDVWWSTPSTLCTTSPWQGRRAVYASRVLHVVAKLSLNSRLDLLTIFTPIFFPKIAWMTLCNGANNTEAYIICLALNNPKVTLCILPNKVFDHPYIYFLLSLGGGA